MTTTMTFRLDVGQREKLRRKARVLGKSESEFLREILNREIGESPMSVRLQKLKGVLSSKNVKMEGWRQAIRERNWRS